MGLQYATLITAGIAPADDSTDGERCISNMPTCTTFGLNSTTAVRIARAAAGLAICRTVCSRGLREPKAT